MTTNQSPQYIEAEKRFLAAQTDEERLLALGDMLRFMPKHKGAEAMRANLRRRYKNLKEKLETRKRKQKFHKKGEKGVKKEEMQAVLVGMTNSGKSSILSCLTNARPAISPLPFTTKNLTVGMMDYDGAKIQLIDMPAVNLEEFDSGIANNTDLLIIVITNPAELAQILPFLEKAKGKRIVVLNKIDLLDSTTLRKFSAQLSSKKYNFVIFSAKTSGPSEIKELKEKIFFSFDKIRIYTKQPNKPLDNEPVILDKNSNVRDVAEKIRKGLSLQVKEARVTGPSSKFPNQKVSLEHVVQDKDIVEFKFA